MTEQKIDLSSASAEELAQLPGIGAVLAQRIVTYRDTVLPFEEPVEIMAVPGISERMYRTVADRLTVGKAGGAQPEAVEEMNTQEPVAVEGALAGPMPPAEPEPEAGLIALPPPAEPETEAEPAAPMPPTEPEAEAEPVAPVPPMEPEP